MRPARYYGGGFGGMGGGPATTKLVIGIAALSILAVVLGRATGVDAVRLLQLTPARVLDGALWQLVTYGFLIPLYGAGSIFYFLITLFFLYSIGSQVEGVMGSRRYLGFILSVLALAAILTVPLAYLLGSAEAPQSGIWVMLGALTILFARHFAHQPIHLMFVLPVRGQQLVWVSFGLWGLAALLEGVAMVLPEGLGLVLALGFSHGAFRPRRAWLRLRAWWIERQLRRRTSRFSVIRGGKEREPGPHGRKSGDGEGKAGGPWLH